MAAGQRTGDELRVYGSQVREGRRGWRATTAYVSAPEPAVPHQPYRAALAYE
jgi:hypothetical protein